MEPHNLPGLGFVFFSFFSHILHAEFKAPFELIRFDSIPATRRTDGGSSRDNTSGWLKARKLSQHGTANFVAQGGGVNGDDTSITVEVTTGFLFLFWREKVQCQSTRGS